MRGLVEFTITKEGMKPLVACFSDGKDVIPESEFMRVYSEDNQRVIELLLKEGIIAYGNAVLTIISLEALGYTISHLYIPEWAMDVIVGNSSALTDAKYSESKLWREMR